MNPNWLFFFVLVVKYRIKKPEGKSPEGRTAEERYKKVHSDLEIHNLARKFLNTDDQAEFCKKCHIKAKPQ